jgi:hypothetical protein
MNFNVQIIIFHLTVRELQQLWGIDLNTIIICKDQ